MGKTKEYMGEMQDMYFSTDNPFCIAEMERLNEGFNRIILGIEDEDSE